MAEKSGFFNARLVNEKYDRTYDASDFASYFANFIGNGIFMDEELSSLKVEAGEDLTLKVSPGKAFIDGYWYELTETEVLYLPVNTSNEDVEYQVKLTLNTNGGYRKIYLDTSEWYGDGVITPMSTDSTSSSSSTSLNKKSLVLATVTVGPAQSEITASDVTDTRLDEEKCGVVSGVVDQINMDNLFNQLESQFNDWFEGIRGQLSEDAAGNLQNQIDDINNGTLLFKSENTTDGTVFLTLDEDEMDKTNIVRVKFVSDVARTFGVTINKEYECVLTKATRYRLFAIYEDGTKEYDKCDIYVGHVLVPDESTTFGREVKVMMYNNGKANKKYSVAIADTVLGTGSFFSVGVLAVYKGL
jgi:hypothetical protein